ncbi:hypothetical protein [Thalassobium sp. R2A62]|uniref:hypothetical protein n=1 Tax=Thalassobium sp. R2A62 TaxID=633131 RepID=UPI0001B1D6BC|nr:hypothetical protein [Thalassobium sp. R2A62]EET49649.1 hypothetical protein TR2A62_1770 [Thalassobium sp. R2A62]
MKNFIIGGLLCLLAALFFGVEPLQRFVNETTSKGTLRGVETCLSYSSSELLSTEVVRSTCTLAFQKPLYGNDNATGKAGPRIDQQLVSWGGLLENKTDDHVTTWIRLSVGIFDTEGNEQTFSVETPIWIEPLAQTEFKVELPDVNAEQFDNLEFCELEDVARKSCMSWGITEIMGLSL